MHVALGVVRFQKEKLRDDDVRDVIGDRRSQEDDAIHEEPRERIICAFPARRALDYVRRVESRHVCQSVLNAKLRGRLDESGNAPPEADEYFRGTENSTSTLRVDTYDATLAHAVKPLKRVCVTVSRVPGASSIITGSRSYRTVVLSISSQLARHVDSSTLGRSTTVNLPCMEPSLPEGSIVRALHSPAGRASTLQSCVRYVSSEPHHAASSCGSVR